LLSYTSITDPASALSGLDSSRQESEEKSSAVGAYIANTLLALGCGLLSARISPSRSLLGDLVRAGVTASSLTLADSLNHHSEPLGQVLPSGECSEAGRLLALRFTAVFAGANFGRKLFGEPLCRLAGRLESDYASLSLNKTNCLLAGPESFLKELRSSPREFDRFGRCKFLACGRDSVALSLEGKVLKLSWKPFPSIKRPFDLPVFEQGKLTAKVYYRLEPRVQMNARWLDEMPFKRMTEDLGYPGLDIHKDNIGTYKGRLVLVDPFHY